MSLPPGKLEYLGEADWLEAVRAHLESQDCDASGAGVIRLGEESAYLKFGPLRGKHRLRHALRSLLPGLRIPRLQEYDNLHWLREHEFGAVRPLCAGVIRRAGLPVFQFLATQLVPDAENLRAIVTPPPPEVFALLGAELARMHGLGFVHRDLYPRNILIQAHPEGWRVLFVDAWRGGPRRGLRGPDYDLACFLLFAPLLFPDACTDRFLAAYFSARGDLPDAGEQRRILYLRVLLLRQLISRERTRHALPPRDWRPDGWDA